MLRLTFVVAKLGDFPDIIGFCPRLQPMIAINKKQASKTSR